jgi:hypothetical protein
MLWDCEFCGTSKLLGLTHRYCPNCGSQQNADKRYYPSDEEKVLVKDHTYHGEDRVCPSCKSLNNAACEFCFNCGTPLSEAAKAARLNQQAVAEGEKFVSSGPRDLVREKWEAEQARLKPQALKQTGGGWSARAMAGVVAGLLLCLGCVGGLMATFFWQNDQGVIVQGHEWERVIEIESYKARPGEAWQDSVPGGAYNLSCSERQRSTRQVQDGETCQTVRIDNGDGTYSERRECTPKYRDEPVYDDYCRYTLDAWGEEREAKASGKGLNEAPAWPNFTLAGSGTRLGAEREGGRREVYTVIFRSTEGGDTYRCNFEQESKWRAYPVESRWTLPVGVVTGSPDCDALKAQ